MRLCMCSLFISVGGQREAVQLACAGHLLPARVVIFEVKKI